MKETSSFEQQPLDAPEKIKQPEHLDIPLEHVLGMQQFLMRLMVPENLKPYVTGSDGESIGIEDELFMRWNNKYSSYFREYCDRVRAPQTNEEAELKERIISGRLTSDDYIEIQQYLEDPVRHIAAQDLGGPLFADEAEEQEFLKPFVH